MLHLHICSVMLHCVILCNMCNATIWYVTYVLMCSILFALIYLLCYISYNVVLHDNVLCFVQATCDAMALMVCAVSYT